MTGITQKSLRDRFIYSPQDGNFRYRANCPPKRAGEIAGWTDRLGYRVISINGRLYLAHRLAFLFMEGHFPNGMVDHINCIRDDNAWSNLRTVTRAENAHNQQRASRGNKSSYLLGVTKKGDRWQAQIKVGMKNKYIGLFDTAEEAHQAYVAEKRTSHSGNML